MTGRRRFILTTGGALTAVTAATSIDIALIAPPTHLHGVLVARF